MRSQPEPNWLEALLSSPSSCCLLPDPQRLCSVPRDCVSWQYPGHLLKIPFPNYLSLCVSSASNVDQMLHKPLKPIETYCLCCTLDKLSFIYCNYVTSLNLQQITDLIKYYSFYQNILKNILPCNKLLFLQQNFLKWSHIFWPNLKFYCLVVQCKMQFISDDRIYLFIL